MKSLQDLRKGKEFVMYAASKGAIIRNGKGSHVIVTTQKGSVVIPVHSGDLGKGLRRTILKSLIAIGLGIGLLVVLL